MATCKHVIEGLKLLAKYDPRGEDGDVCAEHDIVCACPDVTEDMVSAEDAATLHALGWHWSEEFDSWARFT